MFTTLAKPLTVGVDFGGTTIKLGLVDDRGRVVSHASLPTHSFTAPDRLVTGLTVAVRELLTAQRVPLRAVRGVGMGAPGLIDVRRGLVHRLVNVPGRWTRVPLARLLQRSLGRPCVVDNDVSVVALGEWRFGAGRGTRDSVYVTLGTGVGGGLVVNRALVRGASGSAGEIGHTVLVADGPRCACGGRGCLEAFIGTRAILRRARAAIAAHPTGRLARLAHPLTPAAIDRAARAGDAAARAIWTEVGHLLGLGVASVVNLVNPERIVIGGGIAQAWRWFAPAMRRSLRAQAFAVPARAAAVVPAALGSDAGIVGGAVLVWEQLGERQTRGRAA